ncbi:hypothetical protein BDZ91DRAFT_819436 [Kalaharituber pfeilii]|nr:hypothetical protein BDZ91DRAFT_819436 [Kalaharituber pfeilii]
MLGIVGELDATINIHQTPGVTLAERMDLVLLSCNILEPLKSLKGAKEGRVYGWVILEQKGVKAADEESWIQLRSEWGNWKPREGWGSRGLEPQKEVTTTRPKISYTVLNCYGYYDDVPTLRAYLIPSSFGSPHKTVRGHPNIHSYPEGLSETVQDGEDDGDKDESSGMRKGRSGKKKNEQ